MEVVGLTHPMVLFGTRYGGDKAYNGTIFNCCFGTNFKKTGCLSMNVKHNVPTAIFNKNINKRDRVLQQ